MLAQGTHHIFQYCNVLKGNISVENGFNQGRKLKALDQRPLNQTNVVYRRYKLYCQQMHSVVASFETVAGLQNAAPYISFAFKAMSNHFRYLKNAILDQIQFTGKALVGHNIGKDETPRVWTADQGFHSQKAVQSSMFLQHPIWRSQRGLPDHAVAVLRAWLFEHFLHPYPTDLEKQILAQRTSLSRNQVSNWFINARVRLWKPMVEEILTLETKQAQMAAEGEANKPTDPLPSANPLPLRKPFQNTPTQKMEDTQSKRSRNKLSYMFEQRDEQTNFPYNNFSSNYQMGVSGIEKSASKGISLALGLHQNNRIESSTSFFQPGNK
ncbi:BEL1-like homeodomain protein 9 [Vitis vinifera]|uniref:BEL1-like homeodomain protein 9 n=1 Tax=Vitis vinifera TaxID=29760 RepID=A0A438ENQ5_VITVI|nr:BEL1-like homeodomain protein 9 [Vitis vinifera]RVX13694.1 BEL1-like homeodomain protein 9 [Vitis vinifera]